MVTQSESSQKISRQKRIERIPLGFAVLAIRLLNEIPEVSDEPLYDLTRENVRKIEELIDVPFTSFGGVEKYQTLEEKAAAVFCATIRGHKFGNGNKRTAVMLLLAILYINKKWTALSWTELYELAMKTAKDTNVDFETQVGEVAKTLSEKMIKLARRRNNVIRQGK